MKIATDPQFHTILVIDDEPANLAVVCRYLADHGFQLVVAQNGEAGLELARQSRPSLILLDVVLPGIDGFETCRRLKTDERTRDIPVLFMTVLTRVEDKVTGFEAGGMDYITKPFQEQEILARVTTHLRVRDLTRRLQEAGEQALEAQQAAEAANRTKSDFLAHMSHEIRTPINAILGLTNVVLKSELAAEQREHLQKVRIASGNLIEIINDILDFSKVEAGRLDIEHRPFVLDEVFEQLADLFSNRTASKDLELIFTAAPTAPRRLIGDAGRLTQVLINLVENAVKFTAVGEIVVRVDVDEMAEKSPGRVHLRFRVQDEGIGIPPDVLPTLFEPFTQAGGYMTRSHEGTGLGLAICRRLVELMGGGIRVESTPGRGSTFTFTVSLEKQEQERRKFVMPQDLHGLKTLVVDDSACSRQMLSDILESFAFSISTAASGEKALEELRRAAAMEPYQLVLLDWRMQGMDGFQTAKRIANDATIGKTGKLPLIIMVTAYGLEMMRTRTRPPLVKACLFKPVKPSELFNTIMELFGMKGAMVVRVQPAESPGGLTGRRALVVEDNALNRYVAVALLEDIGITVETAEDGKEALDKVTASEQGYDAVLMDIQMPEMDGYEATRQIRIWEDRQKQKDLGTGENAAAADRSVTRNLKTPIPIIALTAHALKGEKEKCLAAGMDDYLPKPIEEEQLHRVLLRWMAPRKG